MDIVRRTTFQDQTETTLWETAIAWALKAGIYDAAKVVRVAHAFGSTNVRLVMTRVLDDGRIELWINLATTSYGWLTPAKLKEHIFHPDNIALAAKLRSHKPKTGLTYHRARNGTDDLVQRSSTRVLLTADQVRAKPDKLLAWLDTPAGVRSRARGTFTASASKGAGIKALRTQLDILLKELKIGRTNAKVWQAQHALKPTWVATAEQLKQMMTLYPIA